MGQQPWRFGRAPDVSELSLHQFGSAFIHDARNAYNEWSRLMNKGVWKGIQIGHREGMILYSHVLRGNTAKWKIIFAANEMEYDLGGDCMVIIVDAANIGSDF